MIKLRDYQERLSSEASVILEKYWIVLLSAEVRTGKTFMALATIKKSWYKNALFLTKKKAISSIEDDYQHYKNDFNLTITNYENIHNIEWTFDIVVCDEVHWKTAWFPKPNKAYKAIKKDYHKIPKILLSWTPLIESASKAYPIFSLYKDWPWKEYANFYKWFKIYWIPKKIYTAYWETADYKTVKYDDVIDKLKHLILTFTQKEAWFDTEITEHILEVDMKPETYAMADRIVRDKVIEWKNDVLIADTWAKLQSVLCQLYSGTIKLDSWNAIIIDDTKAKFVKNYFKGKKIAIMYNFIKEKELLMNVFWDTITDDLEEFKTTNKSFLWQIVSTREWVSLREADALIFYNMPFSWTSFVQWRDRLSHMERLENNVYIICAKWWIEKKIYDVVRKKQTFSNKIFKTHYA